jgi:hypothetical protein
VSGVADTDAAMLEAGRQMLGALLDNAAFIDATGGGRPELVYCFAFPLSPPP